MVTGVTATYTAPPTPSIVTITATSASYTAASASTPITIVTGLSGSYVFSLSGSQKKQGASPPSGTPYSVSGAFIVSDGSISGGEQDYFGTTLISAPDRINPDGSTVIPLADGNVQITLTTCYTSVCSMTDPNVGLNGIETFVASFLPNSSQEAFITEFDGSASCGGTLDLQNTTAAATTPSGGYVFDLNGLSTLTGYSGPIAMAGVINIDGVPQNGTTISGAGSIFDANIAGSGNEFLGQTLYPNSSSVSAPDQFGRVIFSLGTAGNDPQDFFPEQINLAGYVVNASLIRLVEISDAFLGVTGGTAFGQGTNTGHLGLPNVSGNSYVVGLTGFDRASSGQLGNPLQLAGVFSTNSDGTSVSGLADYNDLSAPPQSPYPVTGAVYTIDNPGSGPPDAGTGRVTLTGANSAFNVGPVMIDYLELYLDGNGHATAVALAGTGSVLGGLAFQQVPPAGGGAFATTSIKGAYGMEATGWDHNDTGELDAVGPATAGASGGSFSGAVDLNWLVSTGPTYPDLAVSATLSTDGATPANGVFTGTIKGLDVTSATNNDAFAFYLIDTAGDSIAIETDPNQLTLLYLFQSIQQGIQ